MTFLFENELSVATDAAREAGAIMMQYYHNPTITFKTDKSTLTNVDTECEATIKSRLADALFGLVG